MTTDEAAQVICGMCGHHKLAHTGGDICPRLWYDGRTATATGGTFKPWPRGTTIGPDIIQAAESWLKNHQINQKKEPDCKCTGFDLLFGNHDPNCPWLLHRKKVA